MLDVLQYPASSTQLSIYLITMRNILYLLSASALIAYSVTANGSNLPHNLMPTSSKPVMDTTLLLKSVSLQAREEELAPLGRPPQADRPISFATVFLAFENPNLQIKQITIEQVTIVDCLSQRSLLTLPHPQVLTLNPMEHSTIDIQLNQPKPYGATGSVEAIVTYRLVDKMGASNQLRSAAVSIDRL